MSDIEPDSIPPDFFAPPDIVPALGQPDPLITAVVPPNTDSRLTGVEATNADILQRVAALENP